MHIKGFSLKSEAKNKFTFDKLKVCIEDNTQKVDVTYNNSNEKNNKLYTQTETKNFLFTFDKRVVLDSFTTLPFGYVAD